MQHPRDRFPHAPVGIRGVLQAGGSVGSPTDEDDPHAGRSRARQRLRRLGLERLELHQQERVVGARAVPQPPACRLRPAQHALAHVVAAEARLLQRLPELVVVPGTCELRKGLVEQAVARPLVGARAEDRHARPELRAREHAGEPRRVVAEAPELRPPRVLLVQPGAEAHPAWEAGLARRVVEAVQHRVVHAGEDALVHPELEVLEQLAEDGHGVRHRLEAHGPAPGEVGAGRNVLVHDRRAHDDPVVPRPQPGLALGQVGQQAAFQRVRLAAVGLRAREQAVVVGPRDVRLQETLLEQLHQRAVEVVARPAHGRSRRRLAQGRLRVEHERQVRRELVAAAPRELRRQIVRPVRVVELERVDERGAQRSTEPLAEAAAERRCEACRHVVEIASHRGSAPVVDDRAVRARRPELDVREARLQEDHAQLVAAGRNLQPEPTAARDARTELGAGRELPGPGRHESDEGDARRASLRGALAIADAAGELGDARSEYGGSREQPFDDAHALRLLGRLQEAAAERPARADDDVRGHPSCARAVGGRLHDAAPLGAEPRLLGERRELCGRHVLRHCDGVDLDAADAGRLQHVELSQSLALVHARAVPPPAHERAQARRRLVKRVVQRVAGTGRGRARRCGEDERCGGDERCAVTSSAMRSGARSRETAAKEWPMAQSLGTGELAVNGSCDATSGPPADQKPSSRTVLGSSCGFMWGMVTLVTCARAHSDHEFASVVTRVTVGPGACGRRSARSRGVPEGLDLKPSRGGAPHAPSSVRVPSRPGRHRAGQRRTRHSGAPAGRNEPPGVGVRRRRRQPPRDQPARLRRLVRHDGAAPGAALGARAHGRQQHQPLQLAAERGQPRARLVLREHPRGQRQRDRGRARRHLRRQREGRGSASRC